MKNPYINKSKKNKKCMDYHIILDTTNLFTENLKLLDFNNPTKDFFEFINKSGHSKNIFVYVPELVKMEIIEQNCKFFDETKVAIQSNLKKIHNEVDEVLVDLKKLNEYAFRARIIKKFTENLSKYKLQEIPIPNIDTKQILNRLFTGLSPFQITKGKENGFKDTILWLSILDWAKDVTGEIIFISNNTNDFDEKTKGEFKSKLKKELILYKDYDSAKGYLDKILKLQLNYEAEDNNLKNIIKKNIGEIIIYLINGHSSHWEIYSQEKQPYEKFDSINLFSLIKITQKPLIVDLIIKLTGYYRSKKEDYYSGGICQAQPHFAYNPLPHSFIPIIKEFESEELEINAKVEINITTETIKIIKLFLTPKTGYILL